MSGVRREIPKEEMAACFMDQERGCGPDCMAFNTSVPDHPDYKGQQWPRCLILLNAHRVGKHAVILAESLTKLAKAMKGPDPAAQHANIPPNMGG